MSMVENFVQQLTSANGASAIGGAQKFDLQDDTFAKLLEKQMQKGIDDTDSINQLDLILSHLMLKMIHKKLIPKIKLISVISK